MADDTTDQQEETQEDMQAYAARVVQEVEEERKGDAQIASEHAGQPASEPVKDETPAEVDSGSDDSATVEDQGDDTATAEGQGEDTGSEWFDDDLQAEVTAYGLSKSDVADFASREELERAMRLFDKSALDAGRKALADSDTGQSEETAGQPRGEDGKFLPSEKKESPEPAAPPEGRYEFKQDLYDEDLEHDLKGLRDHYDSRLAAMEEQLRSYQERFVEADVTAKERHFDSLVDSLGYTALFGKTDKESDQEKQRRSELFVEVETYLRGREVIGRPAELSESLVTRMANTLFADDVDKMKLKKRTRKISRQGNGRQGGGATRPQDPTEDPRDVADCLYREMSGHR